MIAIIGGTGLASVDTFSLSSKELYCTEYGEPSSELAFGQIAEQEVVFLSRHGFRHNIPPHKVNYRANILALKQAGATAIIAVNAVGGISNRMAPGTIVIPDQIIDYTYSREHSFYSDNLEHVTHIDFSYPYTASVRNKIITAAKTLEQEIVSSATYACTQGPRLETAAEIKRLANDSCDIVGMTGMPEAALARELNVDYASISFVANWGAGLSDIDLTMDDIEAEVKKGMAKIKSLLEETIRSFV